MGGSAIINAAENFKKEICTMAARALQIARDTVCFVDGRIIGPGGEVHTLRELGITDCAADGTFASSKNTHACGAHAAHVAVDPGTGYVEVLDYFAIEDVGRIINPETLHGQLLGAIVQGLGGTFWSISSMTTMDSC